MRVVVVQSIWWGLGTSAKPRTIDIYIPSPAGSRRKVACSEAWCSAVTIAILVLLRMSVCPLIVVRYRIERTGVAQVSSRKYCPRQFWGIHMRLGDNRFLLLAIAAGL